MAYYHPGGHYPGQHQQLYEEYERRSRRLDWIMGIVLGVVIGIAVLVTFLLLGSESTIDAPRIHGVDTGKPAQESRPIEPAQPGTPPPASEESR